MLKNFVRPAGRERLGQEIWDRKHTTHFSTQVINPYLHFNHNVLGGGRNGVHTLDLRPGDLQIFRGRYSLHSVSLVGADSKPRHAAIFAYTEKPV